MTAVTNNTQYTERQRELYSCFIEKKSRYSVNENKTDNNSGYMDKYIKTVKDHPKGFAIAGLTTLALGGTGIFIKKGAGFRKFIDNIQNNIDLSKITSSESYGKVSGGVKTAFEKTFMVLYNVDGIRNQYFLKGINALGSIKYLGYPFKKIVDFSIKPSTWCSGQITKLKYKSLNKKVKNLSEIIKTTLEKQENKLSLTEKEKLEELQAFLIGDGKKAGFVDFAQRAYQGFDQRRKDIAKTIDEKVLIPYIDEYFPGRKGLREVSGNLTRDIISKDMVRGDKWNAAVGNIQKNIDDTGITKATEALNTMLTDFITPEKTQGSKLLKAISSKGQQIVKQAENTKTFEIENYAGRVLDLKNGGGLFEILAPPIIGGILTKNILQGETPEERKEKFLNGGGIAFVGGLSAWAILQVALSINGPVAIALSIATGITLDTAGKMISKSKKEVKK